MRLLQSTQHVGHHMTLHLEVESQHLRIWSISEIFRYTLRSKSCFVHICEYPWASANSFPNMPDFVEVVEAGQQLNLATSDCG